MSGRSGWLAGGLVLSVLLNLFLAGVVTGRLATPGVPRAESLGALMREQVRQVSPSERKAFFAVMRGYGPQMRAAHERLEGARQAADDAIAAPHYDRSLVLQRFAAVRQATAAQQEIVQNAVAAALATLDAPSRAAIARRAQDEHR